MRIQALALVVCVLGGVDGLAQAPLQARSSSLNQLIEQLNAPSPALRRQAVDELGEMGPAATAAVTALLARLQDEDTVVRNRATAALGYIKDPVDIVAPALIEALADPIWTVRYNAAFALVRLGEAARSFVLEALEDARPWVRLYAADTIRRYPDGDRERAVEVLLQLLETEADDEEIRQTAALAIGKLGPAAAPAVPRIVELSRSENGGYRTAAMTSLESIGVGAREAAPRVREMLLHDEDRYVRRAAATALGAMQDASAATIEALAEALEDEEQRVRNGAIAGLSELGEPAVEATIGKLTSAEAAARVAASDALTMIGKSAHRALPALVRNLQDDPDRSARMAAAIAIGAIAGSGDASAFEALRAARDGDPDSTVRFHAGDSLIRLSGKDPGDDVGQSSAKAPTVNPPID